MARLARQHFADVGQRAAVIVLQIVDRGALVPGFDIVRLDLDDGVEKLDREIVVLGVGRGLDAAHQQIAGVAAGDHPQRPDALLDRFGAGLIGRDLQRANSVSRL